MRWPSFETRLRAGKGCRLMPNAAKAKKQDEHVDGEWKEEPTAVTQLQEEMRLSLAQAKQALSEQCVASEQLVAETKKRTLKQVRKSLTPLPFPAAAQTATKD